jgi:putative hydrolase of the HAD superfamily
MKAVIFDLGSVLVNYDGKATFTAISELAGGSLEELFAHYQTVEHAFGTGQLNGRGYYKMLEQAFGLSESYDSFVAAFCRYQERNEPAFTFARELQARDGVVVGIISNTNEVHAGWLHANVPELRLFHNVILSNEVGLLKPDPAIYELALNQLGISSEQALFVDDLAENVAGGTAVGLRSYLHKDWIRTQRFITNWLAH